MTFRRLLNIFHWLGLFIVTTEGRRSDFLHLLNLIEEDKVAFVDAHNYFRRQVSNPTAANMRLISWDDDLAKFAERVVKTCSFFHTSVKDRRTKQFNPVGENLYTGGDYRFLDIMSRNGVTKLWYDEIQYHDINTLKCQPGKECGHYKQVIWATTHKVGCAIAKCRAIEGGYPPLLVSCNYGPIGNAYSNGIALHPYLKGTPCSKCDARDTCVDRLCNKTGIMQSTITTPVITTIAPTTSMGVSSIATMLTSKTTEGTRQTTMVSTENTTQARSTVSTPSISIHPTFTTVKTTKEPQITTFTDTVTSTRAITTITSSRATTAFTNGTSRVAVRTDTTETFTVTMTTAGAMATVYDLSAMVKIGLASWLIMVY